MTPGKNAGKMSQKEIIAESLRNLDDPIVNDVLVAIIDLVGFFCEEASRGEANSVYQVPS